MRLGLRKLRLARRALASERSHVYFDHSAISHQQLPSDVMATWEDPVGDFRFGYNNDYLSFI
ncbi:hypothetical protein BJP37_23800 [Moorena bouillonii PNG]|uniref:Uncharacterized protein n=2 Tax=Moorena TaxID=1155738 RepID=A0A1U7N6K7_9CYAN|nr:hypothetical protein BJP37_23800 [Moorena bouillonii PNG]